jgi:hypothetical protein
MSIPKTKKEQASLNSKGLIDVRNCFRPPGNGGKLAMIVYRKRSHESRSSSCCKSIEEGKYEKQQNQKK